MTGEPDSCSAKKRYAQMRADIPELFVNQPGSAFEILTDPVLVDEAECCARARLSERGLPESCATTGVVYEDSYIVVLRDPVRFPDASLGTYIRIVPRSQSTGVAIMPLHEGSVVLLRHYRHATRAWHLEIPRGFGEGASGEDDARRELAEEIDGLVKPDDLFSLGMLHPDTGLMSHSVGLYCAILAAIGNPNGDEGISEIVTVKPGALENLIAQNVVTDSFTIAAYLRAKAKGFFG